MGGVRALAFLVLPVSVACGSARPAPPAAPPVADESTSATPSGKSTPVDGPAPETASQSGLPGSCVDPKAPVCTPPGDFVERLCQKPHQDVALALFAPATPFTRAYLRGKLDELAADEEVLVLQFHTQPKGGMVVGSGNGTYDLLRWDGSCSRGIEAEGVTRTRPARPRSAHVQWHRIAAPLQDALVASSAAVKQAHAKRGKECKGAMSGDVSAACEKADDALVGAVVEYVRSGGSLPPVSAVP